MADTKPTENNSRMLGGINLKASEYSLSKAEFLNLRNLDFDVPNALQKRPGSTQAIVANITGPVMAMHEFVRLDGASTIIAASDTSLYYRNGLSLALLDTGWSNGQPPDMLTFVNKEWIANGAKFYGWSGVGASALPAGLPCQGLKPIWIDNTDVVTLTGATIFTVGGATMNCFGSSYVARGVFFAFSYLRSDGYWGPADFLSNARNIVRQDQRITGGGTEFFGTEAITLSLGGYTVPPNIGISAMAIWIAVDTITAGSPIETVPGFGRVQTGNLGWLTGPSSTLTPGVLKYVSATLKPSADTSRFYLFTLLSSASFEAQRFANVNSGVTYFSNQLLLIGNQPFGGSYPSFNSFTGLPGAGQAFTGVPFCFFETYTPKYLENNQNSMFMAGFSNALSNVWFSELGQPENIQPENFFEVRTNDGDKIYGLKAFNNQCIVLKQNSFHKVIGDSPDNYALVELSGEYGCISNRTIIEYDEKLLWLDQKGILQFNGASWDIISNQVEDIFRRMNLSAAFEKACGVHHIYRNQIWWGIPIDGATQNNITVVYDYLVNAWTFFDGFNPASFAFARSGLTKPTVYRGDYSGMIYYHGESFFSDNGTAFTCIATPHWDKHKENETWIWRRAFLDVATVTGLTGQITGKVFSNYDLSTVQATFSMFQDAFQSRAEFGVVGKAVTAEFAHRSASLPLLINNYSWAKRFIRNV